ncbi:MAG: ATP-dependent Clp protease adaptor ClpS [bacterium]|jgi:ATP-dependent Clp protease adaptor protein ClpS
MAQKEKKSPAIGTIEKDSVIKTLILFNDEVNTFDFVIETLIEVCEHDHLQAENCALVAHYKGKCPVKKGPIEDLKPRYDEMTNRKLTVEIR